MMAHKIQNLDIQVFRHLRALNLPGLGRINLLVGANNAGKTTVLETISAFCRPLDPLEWIGTARRREIKSSREPLLDAVRWLFPQESARADDPYYHGEVLVRGDGDFGNRESHAAFSGILGDFDEAEGSSSGHPEDEDDVFEETSESYGTRRGAEIDLQSIYELGDLFSGQRETAGYHFQLWEDERFVSRGATGEPNLPVATVSPVSHRVELLQVRQLTEATLSGAKFSVVEAVRLIDPEIESLEILSRYGISPTLWVRHRRTGYSPLSTLGDGVRRVLSMALNLTCVRDGVLLIDEIETAIHKDALGPVFRWLANAAAHHEVQVFATTQSLEAVDAAIQAHLESLDELVAFRLPTPKTPQILARFSGSELHELRYEGGQEVR